MYSVPGWRDNSVQVKTFFVVGFNVIFFPLKWRMYIHSFPTSTFHSRVTLVTVRSVTLTAANAKGTDEERISLSVTAEGLCLIGQHKVDDNSPVAAVSSVPLLWILSNTAKMLKLYLVPFVSP